MTKTEAVIGETLMAGFGMWITIFPKEDNGEPYEGPLLPFEATFISSEGDVTVADSDEQYVISALFTVATNYTVEITQGGQPIGNSPLDFIIQPGTAAAALAQSTLSRAALTVGAPIPPALPDAYQATCRSR